LREAIEGAGMLDLAPNSTLAEAYFDDIECEVRDVVQERQALQEELSALRGPYDPRGIDRIGNIQKLIDAAVLERGTERGMLLREARNELSELTLSQTVIHPSIWYTLGWVTWQLSENYVEVTPILAKAAHHPAPTTAGYLALRMLAYFAGLDQMPIRAYECARKALDMNQTPEAYVDAGLCAIDMHDPTSAKSHFESALVMRPGSLIGALSDDRILNCGSELIEVAIRVQTRLRRDGRQAAACWSAASREVADAQRICGGGVHVAYDLMESHKSIAERFDEADIIVGGYLNRLCRDSALDVVEEAKTSLQAEYAKRCDAVSMARRSIEHAGTNRENRVRMALQRQEEVVRRAKSALTKSEVESEKAEKNSVFGFGSGCAMFALYTVSYVVLADRGTVIGITTPVGVAATLVSAIPILSAIWIQVAYVMKRMALEAKVNEIIRRANLTFDDASHDADDIYREQMKHSRRALSSAETELRKVESAMRSLGLPKAEPPESATPPEADEAAEPQKEEEPGAEAPKEEPEKPGTDIAIDPAA
jgi:low affinity Fe/Cu permease